MVMNFEQVWDLVLDPNVGGQTGRAELLLSLMDFGGKRLIIPYPMLRH
jgi:hypothetical protein